MASSIELYRDAYDLDYRKGDWQSAEELYRRIVEQHPYSDEKEYALVHLERLKRLKEDPHNQELQPVRGTGGPNALSVMSLLLVLVLVAAAVTGGYFLMQHHSLLSYNDLVLQGVLSEKSGDVIDAAARYQQAQQVLPNNSLAYRCLAELYLDQKNLRLADIESQRWSVASPGDPALDRFKDRLKRASENTEVPK